MFEGVEDDTGLRPPTELSGPSAGQSSIIHVFDIFLGVDHQATSPGLPLSCHKCNHTCLKP